MRPALCSGRMLRFGLAIAALTIGGCTCNGDRAAEPDPDDDPEATAPRDARGPARDARDLGPRPDKDFPTARAAGTEKLFTLEEPDRGPRAPTKYVLPPRTQLVWEDGMYCEDDVVQPACAKTFPGDLFAWRVGRSKTLVVAEQVRNGAVFRTLLYERRDDGTPVRAVELDAYGQVETARMFVAPGRFTEREPTGANALAGCGYMSYELDDKGFSTRKQCLQWNGAAMRDIHNVGAHKYQRDARGFVILDEVAGPDGFGVVDETGVHATAYDRSAPIDPAPRAVHYQGLDGAPVQATSGCAGLANTYDAKGALIQVACLGTANTPVARVAGWAIEKRTVSNLGCQLGVRYFAVDGKTEVGNVDGLHGYDYVRDGHCAELTKSCIGADNRMVACGYGHPAKTVSARDARGHTVVEKHYDLLGEPGQDASYESFELRYTWDAVGNATSTACFDRDGRPQECSRMGFHALKITFDDVGREIEHHFYDEDMRPTTNLGAAVRKFRYDNYDHLAETRNFDAAGRPFAVNGYAIRRDIYDVAHRRAGFLLFDVADLPARYTGCIAGASCPLEPWHAVRILRRVDGSAEKNEFFDENKQKIETFQCTMAKCFE